MVEAVQSFDNSSDAGKSQRPGIPSLDKWPASQQQCDQDHIDCAEEIRWPSKLWVPGKCAMQRARNNPEEVVQVGKHLLNAVRGLRQAEGQIKYSEAADGSLFHQPRIILPNAQALFFLSALGHCGHGFILCTLHLFRRHVFDVGRKRPLMSEWISDDAITVAPELVHQRHLDLCAG